MGKNNKLPALREKDIEKALIKAGATKVRQKGSHAMYKLGDKLVTVPLHGNKIIPEGTLQAILRQSGLTKEELNKWINMSLLLVIVNIFKKVAVVLMSLF